jgi:hypothetical protein
MRILPWIYAVKQRLQIVTRPGNERATRAQPLAQRIERLLDAVRLLELTNAIIKAYVLRGDAGERWEEFAAILP